MRLKDVLDAFDEPQLGRKRDVGRKGDSEGPCRCWWIIREPELHVGDDIAVPDLFELTGQPDRSRRRHARRAGWRTNPRLSRQCQVKLSRVLGI